MSKEYTAIRVESGAKETAKDAKREGETWSEYVQRCAENPPEVKEFVERETSDIDAALAEYDGRLTYDDVVTATRKAIRQELPDGALQ